MENVNRHIHLAHHFRAKKIDKKCPDRLHEGFFFYFHYDEGILYKINQLM